MKILVAYGTERGSTREIADHIAATLRELGHDVEVTSADRARDVGPYGAVVLGGALYAFHWHAHARRFVLRHAKTLRERDVFFFSSGPLDDSASRAEIPPIAQVEQLMDHVGARGHVTFGGRLAPDAKGMSAAAMAREAAGDWRDWARIDAWARELDAALRTPRPARAVAKPLPSRRPALALALVSGLATLAVAAANAIERRQALAGITLAVLVAAPLLVAAWSHVVRADYAALVSLLGGCALAVASVVALFVDGAPGVIEIGGIVLAIAVIADAAVRLTKMFAQWGEAAHPRAG